MANIKQIMLPDGTTYDITMNTVNGHTVNSDVPANAIFTDENVLAEEYNTTAGSWNYPMWRANTSNAGHGLINDGFRYYQKLKTDSADYGRSIIQIGNQYSKDSSVASEKANNKRGEIRLYSEQTGCVNIFASPESTRSYGAYFPDIGDDICILPVSTNFGKNLSISGSVLPKWGELLSTFRDLFFSDQFIRRNVIRISELDGISNLIFNCSRYVNSNTSIWCCTIYSSNDGLIHYFINYSSTAAALRKVTSSATTVLTNTTVTNGVTLYIL